MAWISMPGFLFLILRWISTERVQAEVSVRMTEQDRNVKWGFSNLPRELHNVSIFSPEYSESRWVVQSWEQSNNVSAVAESLPDYQADMAFEDVMGPATVEETDGVPFVKDLSDGWAVLCGDEFMSVTLPAGPTEEVMVLGSENFIPVSEVPIACGYSIKQSVDHNTLTIFFKGCHVASKDGRFTVKLRYLTYDGRSGAITSSCSDGFSNLSPLLNKAISDQAPDESPSSVGAAGTKCKGTSSSNKDGSAEAGARHGARRCVSAALDKPESRPAGKRPGFHSAGGKPGSKTRPKNGRKPVSTPSPSLSEGGLVGGCNIPQSQQVSCGADEMSTSLCAARGCCVDPETSACFYPMDECTMDKNFVFVIYFNETSFPVDSTIQVVAGKDRCPPVVRTDDFAVFKFQINECGTRTYEVGQSLVYMAEVQTIIRAHSLKYGVITRDSPSRFLVECRYPKSWNLRTPSLTTIGYMVKSPSVPQAVSSHGSLIIQVRIATDATYTRYYPHDHQPLRLLLGKPVFLEVRLTPPYPDVVLLVNYCLAYPRSARNALVLLYEGCPNPLDGASAVLHTSQLPQNKHRRRFEIKTFQFMDLKSKKYLNEEIYFMCSAEVCMPSEKVCDEKCFGHDIGQV